MFFRNVLIVLCLSCLCQTKVSAQQALLDSLVKAERQHIKEDTVKANLQNAIAREYREIDADEGAKYAQKAIDLSTRINYKQGLAYGYHILGVNHLQLGHFPEALKYFQEASRIYEALHDTKGMGWTYSGMANAYTLSGNNHNKALFYLNKAVSINRENDDNNALALNLTSIAGVYMRLDQRTKSLHYLQEALQAQRSGNRQDKGAIYYSLGVVYSELSAEEQRELQLKEGEHYHIAIANYLESLSADSETGSIYGQSLDYGAIGDIYFKQKKYPQAIAYTKKCLALSQQMNALLPQSAALWALAQIYAATHRYDSAYCYLQQHLALKDSITSVEKNKDITRKEMQFQFSKREDSLNFQNRLLGKDNALNKLRLRQQWLYSSGGLLLLAGIVGFSVYRGRNRQAKLKSEFERRVSEAALVSLRSQMNPHFIFNCLNSIKLYATENNSEAATEYLDKFSRLMRLVLENSERERILLSRELETLRLYLEMEQIRFKEKLQYEIEVDDPVDIDYIEVPPMLIQPYIENAIWHGLMHKREGGKVWIRFSYHDPERCVLVRIKDDGIGRAKAVEIKSRSVVHNQSYGMKITEERISLINQKYRTAASVIVKDLYDEQQQPAGTEVTIKIPVE